MILIQTVNELSETFTTISMSMANLKGLRNGKPSVSIKALLTQIAKVPDCQGHSVCFMANLKGLRDGKASVSVKPLLTQIGKVTGCQGHSVCFMANLKGIRDGKPSVSVKPPTYSDS